MIPKMNNYSFNKKGKLKVFDYLLDDVRVERGEAYLLRGDVKFAKHLIATNKRKHTYLSGGLFFEKNDVVSDEQVREIMDSFESMIFSGLDKSQYHIVWIAHRDKGRLELNFVIPRMELTRGIDLDVYSHKRDKPLFSMWRNGVNKKYNLADPMAASRRRTAKDRLEAKQRRGKGNFEGSFVATRADLDQQLIKLVETGTLQSKAEIREFLSHQGYEITRDNKNSLSVKHESLGKTALRLKHPIYQDSFKSLADLPEIKEKPIVDEPIPYDESVYQKYLKRRTDRHLKRYKIKEEKEQVNDKPREDVSRSESREREERPDYSATARAVSTSVADLIRNSFPVNPEPSTKRSKESVREPIPEPTSRRTEEVTAVAEPSTKPRNRVQESVADLIRNSFRVDTQPSIGRSGEPSRELTGSRSQETSQSLDADGMGTVESTLEEFGRAFEELSEEVEKREQRSIAKAIFNGIGTWFEHRLKGLLRKIDGIGKEVENRLEDIEAYMAVEEIKAKNKASREGKLPRLDSPEIRSILGDDGFSPGGNNSPGIGGR
jgi:hypothetical protein